MIISKYRYEEDMRNKYANGLKHGRMDGRLEILQEQSERKRADEKQRQVEYMTHAATASLGTYGERRDDTYTCKRCGVVYVPKVSAIMLKTLWHDGPVEMQCAPFEPDETLLLCSVGALDYCPRCEVAMKEKRDMLAWALSNTDEVARIKKLADDKEDK